jgi:spore germination protein
MSIFAVCGLLADSLVEPAYSGAMLAGGVTSRFQTSLPSGLTDRGWNRLVPGVPRRPKVYINGWVADFSHKLAMRALRNEAAGLSEVSLFAVGGDSQGRLLPETEFIRLALHALSYQPQHPRVLLTVANNRPGHVQDRLLLNQWLGNGKKWSRHAHQLMGLASSVDGLDLDYENLPLRYEKNFARFVMYLGRKLHGEGKYLTVTVEATTFVHSDMDWRAISAEVDRIRVMAYPYNYEKTNPGSVCPPDWAEGLARRGLQQVPADKLEIALPLFGYDWASRGHGRVLAMPSHYETLMKHRMAWHFHDDHTRSARIDYIAPDAHGRLVRHEVWYDDAESALYKIQRLHTLGIRHIGLWQLGIGDLAPLFQGIQAPDLSK